MATNKNSYIICNTIESCLKIKSNNTAIREIVKSAEKEMEKTNRPWVIRYIPVDLIEIDENRIKLTDKGLDLANVVWEEFV